MNPKTQAEFEQAILETYAQEQIFVLANKSEIAAWWIMERLKLRGFYTQHILRGLE